KRLETILYSDTKARKRLPIIMITAAAQRDKTRTKMMATAIPRVWKKPLFSRVRWMELKAFIKDTTPLVERYSAKKKPNESSPCRGLLMMSMMVDSVPSDRKCVV